MTKAYLDQDLEYKSKEYISYYFYKLKKKNHSFILNSRLNIIPQLKLYLIPENDKESIFHLIEAIISKKVYFLDFLKEDYGSITEDVLKSAIHVLKYKSKICFIKFKEKEKNDSNKNYKFISIILNDINPNDNIFIKCLEKFNFYLS